MTMTRKFIQKH